MGRRRANRRIPPKYKRSIMVVSILLAISLLAYAEVIRPNLDAKTYTNHLSSASTPLQKCFEQLAGTTELSMFYAPDVELRSKEDDTTAILRQIDACRIQLNRFEQESRQLAGVPLGSLSASYRQAKVHQRQAFDVIGQSNDVLNQYHKMATFLAEYYAHIAAFSSYASELQTNEQAYISNARLRVMEQQAANLHERAATITKLEAPREFAGTKTETAAMFSKLAGGFDSIIVGIRSGDGNLIQTGYRQADEAAAFYDSTVINLPFDQLTKSYIPTQVEQLPVKVENLLTTSSE